MKWDRAGSGGGTSRSKGCYEAREKLVWALRILIGFFFSLSTSLDEKTELGEKKKKQKTKIAFPSRESKQMV